MTIDISDILYGASALAIVAIMLLFSQYLWKKKRVRGERSRKLVHILSSAWIALWRLFIPQPLVILMGVGLFMGVFVSRRLKLFRSIYTVRRPTYGEMTFATGVILTAIFFKEPAVYGLAILNLGLVDGLAAIVGREYGSKSRFKVFGSTKSIAGTLTAFQMALITGICFWLFAADIESFSLAFMLGHILFSSALITVAELVGYRGFDNVLIPIVTGLLFMWVI